MYSLTFQHLGRHYVGYINGLQGRTGTLWEGRYKASVIDSERYLFSCYRYIELNPVRAEMVAHPRDYRWSSYRANAEGEGDDVVSPHPLYLVLAADNESRLRACRKLFSDAPDPGDDAAIRDAISHNHFLGDEDFRMKLERLAGRTVSASSRGRPSKQKQQANDAESTGQQRSLDLV